MSFGQRVLERERSGNPVDSMWIVFDQKYRNSYVFAAELFPADGASRRHGMTPASPTAQTVSMISRRRWACRQDRSSQTDATIQRGGATPEIDSDFHRGESAYDRYYGDPTITPNPNLRPLWTRGRSMR